jgi:hypothetical protein
MSKSFLVLFLKKELLAFTLRESDSMPIGIKHQLVKAGAASVTIVCESKRSRVRVAFS